MEGKKKPEDPEFTETELEILGRIERGEIPLETPLSEEYRIAIRGLLEKEHDRQMMRARRRKGSSAEEKHLNQTHNPVKRAGKSENGKRDRNPILPKLALLIRKIFFKDSHLMVSEDTNVDHA